MILPNVQDTKKSNQPRRAQVKTKAIEGEQAETRVTLPKLPLARPTGWLKSGKCARNTGARSSHSPRPLVAILIQNYRTWDAATCGAGIHSIDHDQIIGELS